jgi:hypothetical protein
MSSSTTLQPSSPSLQNLIISVPLGLCIGAVNVFIIRRLLENLAGMLLSEVFNTFVAVLLSGVIAGAIQGSFLRPHTRPIVAWLIVTGFGWMAAYGLMRYFYSVNNTYTILPTFGELSLGLGMGFLVGITQWLVLQQRWKNAYLWIVSTVIVWSITWAGMTYFLYAIMGPAL